MHQLLDAALVDPKDARWSHNNAENAVKFMKNTVLLVLSCIQAIFFPAFNFAQNQARLHVPPVDPLVQRNLAEWQDLKFGRSCTGGRIVNGALYKVA